MASDTITEPQSLAPPPPLPIDMDLETSNPNPNPKRDREEENEVEEPENGAVSKKQKPSEEEEEEKSVEEERMERETTTNTTDGGGDTAVEEKENAGVVGPVTLGPKTFESSVEMFDYFYKLLHHWPLNVAVNKYENLVLLELIKKGHPEPEKKVGSGIKAFEIRHHPMWKSRCFFVIRADDSVEDFSFRKCVDHILPLPENMRIKSDVNKALGGGGKRGGGRGRGRGRGGRSRR